MLSTQGADTDTCDVEPPLRKALMSTQSRLTSWIDWYRFARRTLGLFHSEAVSYANARYLEEQSRRILKARDAA